MTETANQTGICSVQCLVDRVKAVKIVPQKRISERMCEQLEVIEVPKNSRQESVEIVKNIAQEQMFEPTREQIGVIEVPKI